MHKARTILAALAAALAIGGLPAAQAQTFKAGDIEVTRPWSRATPHGAKIGAGYLVLTNRGNAPDRLLSVTTTAAGKVELHEMSMQNGVMRMRQLGGGIALPPGRTVTFAPGGLHMMFMELAAPLKQGQQFTARLVFEKAGPTEVTFDVRAIGGGGHAH